MTEQTSKLMAALARVAEQYPHWRFGQVVANVAAWAGEERPGEVWEVTDEQLLRAAEAHLARVQSGGQAPGQAVA